MTGLRRTDERIAESLLVSGEEVVLERIAYRGGVGVLLLTSTRLIFTRETLSTKRRKVLSIQLESIADCFASGYSFGGKLILVRHKGRRIRIGGFESRDAAGSMCRAIEHERLRKKAAVRSDALTGDPRRGGAIG